MVTIFNDSRFNLNLLIIFIYRIIVLIVVVITNEERFWINIKHYLNSFIKFLLHVSHKENFSEIFVNTDLRFSPLRPKTTGSHSPLSSCTP